MLRIFFKERMDLTQNLLVCEMIHDNGAERAFGSAGPAPGTGGRIDHSGCLSLDIHADGVIGADLCTFSA